MKNHSTRTSLILIAMMMLVSVFLAACGKTTNDAQSAAPAAKPGAASSSNAPRKIKHAMGETTVPAHPQRIVILTMEGTETLLALGVKPSTLR